MLFPIKIFDFDLSGSREDVPVTSEYRSARVLVRWDGLPLGTVQVPVCSGQVRHVDITALVVRQLSGAIAREAARRGLVAGIPPESIRLAHQWRRQAAAPAPGAAAVSLVICSRDRPADLELCLAAVARLAPAPLETIVVDNAPSTDATAELLRNRHPTFRYVREDRPGLDHARNRGIHEARGEIIAFTDDDVIVDPFWIGALASAFAADPAVGLITGLTEPAELETEAQVIFEAYGGFGRGYRSSYLQAPAGAPLPWSLIGAGQLGAGANMAFRRQVFDQVGGFDPALDVGTPTRGGGDHEIFFRVIKSGWTCLYEPAALVRHRHRRTLPQIEQLLFDYGHATRCFFERAAREFPEDARAIRRLHHWWLREWAARRWCRAAMRPAWFPPHLVWAEIRGYFKGRGAYARTRSSIVTDEAKRPDAFRCPPAGSETATGIGFVAIDLAHPLRDVTEGRQFAKLHVIIRHHGRTLGAASVATLGHPLVVDRLADLIAGACPLQLLHPSARDEFDAWSYFQANLENWLARTPAPAAALPDSVTVTVIVPTCGRPEALRRCLRSIAALRTRRLVQRIVVDNRPDSRAAAAVLEEFPGVERVEEFRPGASYARNAGIAAARGELVVMTDDDMEVAPDWLEQLVAPFVRADVLAVTGNTLPARIETEAERMFESYGGFGRGFSARVFDRSWFLYYRRRAAPTWQIGGTGNAAFRTEIFSWPQIGGFDERLGSGAPTGVGEDTKLFYDILHAGYSIAYEPGALAWHHHRVSMPELQHQLYGYSRGHVAYHLVTWRQYGDKRALVRLALELPEAYLRRCWRRLRGGDRYPWRLLWTEMAGTLAGPWSLWCAGRKVRRFGRGARRAETTPPSRLRAAARASLKAAQ